MCPQRFFERVQTRNPRWKALAFVCLACSFCLLLLRAEGLPALEWPPHAVPSLLPLGTIAASMVCLAMHCRVETFRTGQLKLEHLKRDEVELSFGACRGGLRHLARLMAQLNEGVANGSLKPGIQIVLYTSVFGCARLEELGFRVRRLWCEERWGHAGMYSLHWCWWRLAARLKGRNGPKYYGGPWWEGRQELGVLLDRWYRRLENRAGRRRAGND